MIFDNKYLTRSPHREAPIVSPQSLLIIDHDYCSNGAAARDHRRHPGNAICVECTALYDIFEVARCRQQANSSKHVVFDSDPLTSSTKHDESHCWQSHRLRTKHFAKLGNFSLENKIKTTKLWCITVLLCL